MYIESRAYVSNLRQKLVCGSALLAPRMHYYEWWSRALIPGTHFVQVGLLMATPQVAVFVGAVGCRRRSAGGTTWLGCRAATAADVLAQVSDGPDMCDDFVQKVRIMCAGRNVIHMKVKCPAAAQERVVNKSACKLC